MPHNVEYRTKAAKEAYMKKMKKDKHKKKKGMGYAYGKDSKKMSHGKDYKNHIFR